MVSPRSSPLPSRRVGVHSMPPPLPPRRSSPTLGSPSLSPSAVQQHITVPKEDAPPPPGPQPPLLRSCTVTILPSSHREERPVVSTPASTSGAGASDGRYDMLQAGPSSSPSSMPSPRPQRQSVAAAAATAVRAGTDSIAEHEGRLFEEPSYENTSLNPVHSIQHHPSVQSKSSVNVETNNAASTSVTKNKPTVSREGSKEMFAASEYVSYENLNMDYIAQLTSEGYAQEAVIRALGITRNDVSMACDILHEFATKQV
ncbi:hypothetical protein B566_EDAN010693 [Ephemera danica]|nr:hypothetical protein B566_EDAN010693 [Ephemera danica]